MNNLHIEKTSSTPKIDFNTETKVMKIDGQSYPENAFKFYEPILSWIDEFLENEQEEISIEINFHLPYINSSSTKCIMMMLDKFENHFNKGKKISVKWYYDVENESSFECAEEFKEDLTLPFQTVIENT
ncbi:protein of unknown function [Desulfonispora thiosulfatigenes DSM 11270]|uniref:SiaC family regulatory phosphoprotein domain-containing protein n=1 Tax=Desulfonispora thiosulfatigenes DSM 11270 TaxID=656914 RepID=A0A1W1VAK7_DESTI|nr:DUF1987 domain-containing protein [Desulfonispora thiosulfatigenes]SMB90316.1 protein of unknown function [Desulfonispora thiosulfatigenes DSM 11270]